MSLANSKAKSGEFYFARFVFSNGVETKRPVFVVAGRGTDNDLVVCACTTHEARSESDVKVRLSRETCVRTNKLYTLKQDQLMFRIRQKVSDDDLATIMQGVRRSLNLV
jgi:hypothetical protein